MKCIRREPTLIRGRETRYKFDKNYFIKYFEFISKIVGEPAAIVIIS